MAFLRSCSGSLALALAGGVQLWSADLFTFTLADGVTVYNWTSWPKDLVVSATTYSSRAPWLKRGQWSVENTMVVATMDVTLMALNDAFDGGANIKLQIHNGLFDGASFLLSRAYMTAPDVSTTLGTIDLFGGIVGAIDLDGGKALITCKAKNNLLDQPVPRNVYQLNCLHTFCDVNCGLDRADFTSERSVGSGSTRSFLSWGPGIESLGAGVNLIPGAGEFVYDVNIITDGTTYQNYNTGTGIADMLVSLNQLEAAMPNIQTTSIVVGWFGSDLRVGNNLLKPGVEIAVKTTTPETWSVNGVSRAAAHVVSQVSGEPAYGGTPSDESIVQTIVELKSRGIEVGMYPFIFMDIPTGNTLNDPYSNNAASTGQSVYPWRGRMTCSPAAGYTGTVDKTAAAQTQVDAFFGTATVADFLVAGTTVTWIGGTDWGLRRMILHYALLSVAAGGIDNFLIGSELVGLTRIRSAATVYPAVNALVTLAADVKAIVGPTCKVSYAADWSEYNLHQTNDAPGALQFNLDPLWSSANIDFIGIDNYMKLADWRDGGGGIDYNVAGPTSQYDRDYLQGNIRGGEDYDFYYASTSDRNAQIRSAITDGAYNKPWVYRQKDIWNWWGNLHYDRVAGVESGSPTAWVAESKPIRFTELGCPAIDKGANQPNVFYDPKSSESAVPYYSDGTRDDYAQRSFLEAHLNYWNVLANNPVSSVYGLSMLDYNNTCIWSWDARPYPYFPQLTTVWGDCANWYFGHWLNGRIGDDTLTKYRFGTVKFLSGLNSGQSRNISISDATGLTLSYPLYFTPSEGDGITIFEGCDKSQTRCQELDNENNRRAYPYVPPPDSAY